MQVPLIAAMMGLVQVSRKRNDAGQRRLGQGCGRTEFADVGTAGKRFAGAHQDDGLDRIVRFGATNVGDDARAQRVAQAIDRRTVHDDDGDVLVFFVACCVVHGFNSMKLIRQ